jgi:site-specific DNA recombinase
MMGGWDEVFANGRLAQEVLCDCSAIETEFAELHREIGVVSELTRKSIYENARLAVSQDEFN